jgi:1-deoxy-D-xylulose-5-phosphate reductoisomerase
MKGVALLGATGSIGRSAAAVMRQHQDRFRPVVVTGHRNRDALEGIVAEWQPELAILSDGEVTGSRTGRV